MESYEQGYEDERFENSIGQNFHCPICMNVFKDPVMCQRNQHCFCRPCITRHLQNSQTCPSCMEDLTLDTVRRAPRIFLGCLSELNIRCDYFSRGCREFVPLEKLEIHVKDCGFAPVNCSNEGCLVEINKRDRAHHEAETCELRKVKCHKCAEMTKMMEDMNINLMATKNKLDQMELKQLMDQSATSDEIREIKSKQNEIMREIQTTRTKDQSATSNEIREIKSKQDEIMREIQIIRYGTMPMNEKPSIVVAGGSNDDGDELKSVEMFDWSTRSWSQLQPMKKCRYAASSFVYENQIIVTGGFTEEGTIDSMEQIKIAPALDQSEQWRFFAAKLPEVIIGHKTIVYNERLIVIGGEAEDSIHEVLLYPPYSTKLLATMPEVRGYHGVELFNDKIFILGGSKSGSDDGTLDSVLMYDINNNKCQQMTSLPVSANSMSTVKWGDNIILLGGQDEDGNSLNTVIIYNVRTGKSHMLPQMKCKRDGCTAVVSGNTIVVMGGFDEKSNVVNSVECFTFDCYSWEDLPPMNEERVYHIAETL